MDKINVNLYGGKGIFGGRERPLEADEIYCDMYDTCSFYKENKCLRCRSFLAPTCKFGNNHIQKGYTSRARKYYQFKSKYINDEVYNKLKYPNELAAIIGDTLFMNLKYVNVYKRNENTEKWEKDINGYIIDNCGFTNHVFIPLKEITNNLLYSIFSYKPRTILGNDVIEDYNKKVVPDILQSLKKIAPAIYNNFIFAYPEYDIAPNYVGKNAYIKTMVDGAILKDVHGNVFTLRNGKLYCEEYKLLFLPFKAKSAAMEINVTHEMIYTITDNSQCDENTKFD